MQIIWREIDMKKLTKFDVILNIWVSLIINVALSIVLPALNGFLT